jgi:N-acetylmuramoyl-L-alanine amidase
MKIVISSGHGKYVRGASGFLDEVDEARRVVEQVAVYLRENGTDVKTFHDDTSHSQNENLNTIVNYHNAQTRDLDVSVHFNAYESTSRPMGTEVLYVTQSELASTVSNAIAEAGTFLNRGAKYRSDLFFLNSTEEPSILLEVCFVDSSADAMLYNQWFDRICRSIAETISGEEVPDVPETEPPVEEPPPLTGDNRVEIQSEIHGDVTIIINDERVVGHEGCEHVVDMTIKGVGDVTLVINGEEFHNKPPGEEIPLNQKDIEATEFGGSDDPNESAYPPHDLLDGDNDLFVALPFKFTQDPRPLVRVFHGEVSAEAKIMDVGPWMTTDNYWEKGTRPLAETCHLEGSPLPSGPNAGKVPSNKAGIDLSPALAEKIGVEGKGQVHWVFVH